MPKKGEANPVVRNIQKNTSGSLWRSHPADSLAALRTLLTITMALGTNKTILSATKNHFRCLCPIVTIYDQIT